MWRLCMVLLSCVLLEGAMAQRTSHQFKVLTSKRLKSVMQCSTVDLLFQYDLPGVLKPRVPGTQSHEEVKEYIISRLNQLSCTRWNITLDSFSDHTPLGVKPFTNIVATLDPAVDKRLVIAAHYDSKLLTPVRGKQFLGATDSALPVALLLDLIISLDDKLQKRGLSEYSLQVIFFDGEEALVSWTESDSLYGSRHLAAEMGKSNGMLSVAGKSAIEAMDAFILLDLIGYNNPKFYNMYPATSDLFQRFSKIEKRLLQENYLSSNYQSFFSESALYGGGIEDDHKPFLQRGVPILHFIANPFPPVWHELSDDASAIDRTTVENFKKIMMVFLHEYFSL